MAARRYCAHTQCHQFAVPGGYYCQDHAQSTAHDYRRDRTDVAEQAFYRSTEWRQAREWKLAAQPLCQDCLAEGIVTPATLAHHVKDIKDFPLLALEQSNLRSLCEDHHNKAHRSKGGNHG